MSSTFHLLEAMKKRLEFFFLTKSNLTVDASAGDTTITVDDVSQFSTEGLREDFKRVLVWDNNTTGRLIQGGREGADQNVIKDVAAKNIYLEEPLSKDFLVSDGSIITRAPAGVRVKDIILGDVRVRAKYPAITIVPRGRAIDFTTFSGTQEKFTIDFMIYIKDDDTQDAMGQMLLLSDALLWILMSNQHIAPTNSTFDFEVTSKAHVRTIDYGTIEKGSEFIKACKLSWEADMYIWRSYISSQNSSLGELPLPVNPIDPGC